MPVWQWSTSNSKEGEDIVSDNKCCWCFILIAPKPFGVAESYPMVNTEDLANFLEVIINTTVETRCQSEGECCDTCSYQIPVTKSNITGITYSDSLYFVATVISTIGEYKLLMGKLFNITLATPTKPPPLFVPSYPPPQKLDLYLSSVFITEVTFYGYAIHSTTGPHKEPSLPMMVIVCRMVNTLALDWWRYLSYLRCRANFVHNCRSVTFNHLNKSHRKGYNA